MKVNPGKWLLAGAVFMHLATMQCFACTMSLPSLPSNEWEIEIETEDYDSSTNMVRYKVEIEVEVFSPTASAQCVCSLNLGATSSLVPATFDVINATVGLRSEEGDDVDLAAFDGFSRDSQVESDVANLASFQAGASAFGFSLDVSPFTAPTINPGDLLALVFEIEFNLDDYDQVNGSPIQFAAGSNETGHALSIFNGYQATLRLPPLSTLPIADFDSDGDVDGGDFLAFQRGYGISEGARLQDGDADHDGEVDDDDFKVWREMYGTGGIGAASVSIPEPGSFVLGLLGMLTMAAIRGRA